MGFSLGDLRNVTVMLQGKKAGDNRITQSTIEVSEPYFEEVIKPLQKEYHTRVQSLYAQIQKVKEEI
jgi:hypothetical protein